MLNVTLVLLHLLHWCELGLKLVVIKKRLVTNKDKHPTRKTVKNFNLNKFRESANSLRFDQAVCEIDDDTSVITMTIPSLKII